MTNSSDIVESGGGKIAGTHTPVSTTVAKAIGILDILALTADSGISLTELSGQIEMPKSSTYRYLVTLEELGLAQPRPAGRDRFPTAKRRVTR